MSLPRAVLEAEARANQLIEEQKQQSQAPAQPEVQPQQQPQPQAAQPAAAATPEPTEQPQPTGSPATPPTGSEAIENRYKVLQGKYNAEVPRLAADNRELKAKLEAQEREIAALKLKAEPLVRPEEIAQYGEGLIDVTRRVAAEAVAAKQPEIDALNAKLEQVSVSTAQKVDADFFAALAVSVPDWQQLNLDNGFLSWLDEVDELTGETRQTLLSRAEQSRDAVRTAKFFSAYKKASQSWVAQSNQALESQQTPSATRTPNAPPAKKIWTRGEVADFYARVRRGEIGDAEAVATEADLYAAQVEGRIR